MTETPDILVSYPGPACSAEAVAFAARVKPGEPCAHLPRLELTLVAGEQRVPAEAAELLIASGTVAPVKPLPRAKAPAITPAAPEAPANPVKG